MYHVRSVVDPSQRMVPEGELAIVMPDFFDRPDGSGKVRPLFPRGMRVAVTSPAAQLRDTDQPC